MEGRGWRRNRSAKREDKEDVGGEGRRGGEEEEFGEEFEKMWEAAGWNNIWINRKLSSKP